MKPIPFGVKYLHYTKYLERSGRISGTILIVIGLYFLWTGIKRIAQHLHMRKTEYTIVSGKVIAWDKKVSHVKLSKKTEFFPTLDFSYEGKDYIVKSTTAFGEETKTAFDAACKDGRFEIRVPVGNPYAAVPNYELDRNEKLYGGLCAAVLGAVFVIIGAFFIISRPKV